MIVLGSGGFLGLAEEETSCFFYQFPSRITVSVELLAREVGYHPLSIGLSNDLSQGHTCPMAVLGRTNWAENGSSLFDGHPILLSF